MKIYITFYDFMELSLSIINLTNQQSTESQITQLISTNMCHKKKLLESVNPYNMFGQLNNIK